MDELHRDNSRAALMEQVNWIYRVFKKRKTENELRGIKSRLDWPLAFSGCHSGILWGQVWEHAPSYGFSLPHLASGGLGRI